MELYLKFRMSLMFLQTLPAIAMFGSGMEKRNCAPVRAVLVVLAGVGGCYALSSALYFPGLGTEAVLPRTLCMISGYILFILLTWFFYRVSIWSALLIASAGYAAQNAAGSLKGLIKMLPPLSGVQNPAVEITLDLLCYLGLYAIIWLAFRRSIRAMEERYDDHTKAVFSFVVMLLCIGMSRITQDNLGRNMLSGIAEWIYGFISSIMLLMVQYSVLDRNKMARDVDTMAELIHHQQHLFEASKENAQLVNEKYHDLKQILSVLSGRVSQEEVERLQATVSGYDAAVHTGNDVLDVILTEKRMRCNKDNIQITCLAGGVDLSFLSELDQYSLLSNALNNAINAVSQLPEGVDRGITLSIRQEGDMTFLHTENQCPGAVSFRDGIPLSQGDSRYHGFGMKSMRRTAEKYGGTLTARQEGNIFILDIMLLADSALETAQVSG